MDMLQHAKFLLGQAFDKRDLKEKIEKMSLGTLSLYGENPRKTSASFAKQQAESRHKMAAEGKINAFGMKELINQLTQHSGEDEILFYYVKTEGHTGEIYFLKDSLIGVQFVERKHGKYAPGYRPDML